MITIERLAKASEAMMPSGLTPEARERLLLVALCMEGGAAGAVAEEGGDGGPWRVPKCGDRLRVKVSGGVCAASFKLGEVVTAVSFCGWSTPSGQWEIAVAAVDGNGNNQTMLLKELEPIGA